MDERRVSNPNFFNFRNIPHVDPVIRDIVAVQFRFSVREEPFMKIGEFHQIRHVNAVMDSRTGNIVRVQMNRQMCLVEFPEHFDFFLSEWVVEFHDELPDDVHMLGSEWVNPIDLSTFDIHLHEYICGMLGLGVVVQQIMEIGYFGCLVLADVFLDELNLVAEFGFREFGDGTVEGVDRQMMIGKELIPDEILFETDIVADTSGEQGTVF